MKTAFIFPGQGSQLVGMGKDLYKSTAAARAVFDRAEAVTGLPLKKLCFEGPEEELARTDICQPAIFTVSAAMLGFMDNLLDRQRVSAMRTQFMAGLSLGEYTALFAADMIDFDDALRLVARRGAAMQAAATAVPSGMVIVMGLDESGAEKLAAAARNGNVLSCANFNCPGQIVLSGHAEACKRAETMAKLHGAVGAVKLKVAGAFHSAIMRPAADELAAALEKTAFRAPRGLPVNDDRAAMADPSDGQNFATAETRVVSNVDAKPYACNGCVKLGLLAQLTSPVRWQQSMEYLLAQGVERFYEIGPGRVLAGLMRRTSRKAEVICLNSQEAVEKMANT